MPPGFWSATPCPSWALVARPLCGSTPGLRPVPAGSGRNCPPGSHRADASQDRIRPADSAAGRRRLPVGAGPWNASGTGPFHSPSGDCTGGGKRIFHCAASERILGLFLGGEDLTADLRCKRTKEGKEIDYARQRVVCAARAAGVEAFDTPLHRRKRRPGPLGRRAGMPRAWALRERPASLPAMSPGSTPSSPPQQQKLPMPREVLAAIADAKRQGPGRHFPPRKNDRRTHCHKGPADPVCRPNSGTDWR